MIAIIAALAAMATPVIMKQQKKAAMTTAISNAKQVFMLMVEFDQDFGAFPSTDLATDNPDLGPGGTTSNKLLAMFIEGGYVQSEEIFYAKGGSKTNKKPDNVITGGKILEPGECGFAYTTEQSTSNNSGRPVLMAPMSDSGNTFKRDPYDGKAVALRLDGSVQTLRLKKATGGGNTDGEALIGGGKTLFQTGQDSVWGDDNPVLAYPE